MSWRKKYGPHFPCCSAIEAIRAEMDQAYARQREVQQEIRWLSGLLVRRSRELQAGTWPTVVEHESRAGGG